MLEDAERRVARLEAALRDLRERPAPVVYTLESSIMRYLDDLRGTVETNVEELRWRLLTREVERIMLQRDGAGQL